MSQIDLIERKKECPYYDGELCYFHKKNEDPNSKYPKQARLFKCPEKNRYARSKCRLKE